MQSLVSNLQNYEDKMDELKGEKDLISPGPDDRNWRGIGIALLVIVAVCALIVAAVILLTPADKGLHIRNVRLDMREVIGGNFEPATFNGTWITDDEYMFQDKYGAIVLYNVDTKNITVLMTNISYNRHYIDGYSLSPDKNYLLIVQDIKKIYRYSFTAKYQIYNISDDKLSPLLPKNSSIRYQYAEWGTKGTQLVYVYENNIYYLPSVFERYTPTPLSHTGVLGAVLNGIPDWIYEEEIFLSNKAIWWSLDGTKLCYATFNDTEVDITSYSWYGSHKDVNIYPEIVQIRYPKPDRKIPTIKLLVVDLTPGKFVPQTVHPPREYADKDYYVTSVQWIDSNQLAIVWLQRLQNSSIISICYGDKGWKCVKNYQVSSDRNGWVEMNNPLIFSSNKQNYFIYLPKSEGFSGNFRHVAMINVKNSSVQFLTSGKYDVVQLLSYYKANQAVYFISTLEDKSGEQHLFAASSHKNITCLSCNLGKSCLFNNARFSLNAKYFILECLGPDIPQIEMRRTIDNKLLYVINDNKALRELVDKRTLPKIRSFKVPLHNGYKANVRLFLPAILRDDEITKYPMVVNVDGSPGSQLVNEKFSIHWGTYLASKKNYIYAWIDGRGSGNRGEKILHEIYRRLGTVEVEDQVSVTRYMKSALPFIDEKRVAIWGWAYGGYASAMALASDDGAFSCGISVAPITSWLYYDSVYSERYMQFSDPSDNSIGYKKADLMKKAANMRRKKYLLVHGTADDSVHIQQSMLLIKALTDAGVIFRTQIYPDEKHSLHKVIFHLYWTMEDFLEQCFSSDQQELEIGLQKTNAVKSDKR
ncbi:inactive dipeptidyl peptidase 10-like isoform X2 [Centruroides vittatus]|uniref:inactive dipeptidyl peptidase 10-like isoform X2 n=1 Tax=Centruroides vittatus TaxID=120091 RepID=UPI00350F584D